MKPMNYGSQIRNLLLLCGLVVISLIIPCASGAGPTTGHPFLLFHDISEVPGYQYRTIDPWKGWEASIMSGANGSLSRNFSANLGGYDRISYRSQLARDLGMAYQLTGTSSYALKAREALLNLEIGTVGEEGSNAVVRAKNDKAGALMGYSLAYDWVQPTLDPATDIIIRDKLAVLADTVYKDLNDNGTNPGYISFYDHLGQAYPTMGVASAVLYDYTNPNHLPLVSTPSSWQRAATEYLFENDLLHSYNCSLLSFGFDEVSGKSLNGAYKAYVMDDFALWFQVSNHAWGENLLDTYPAVKRAFTSEVWESLPNGYSDNFITNGNMKWTYHKAITSLLPDSEKSMVLNHLDRIEKSTILPYSGAFGTPVNTGGMTEGISPAFVYCVYGNYASLPRTFPTDTSHLDPHAMTQVFRGSWNNDSGWLSLITFNTVTRSNRDMAHNDQLSFEYYSRGDLLLADGGEEKHVLDKTYGINDISHNTIAIENPRTPFSVSPQTGSSSLGIFKGYNVNLVTPPTVGTIIQAPWIQALQANVTITKLSPGAGITYTPQNLSSPVHYQRAVLYPETDYFVIVDRMEGTEAWTYRTIFRPTSLMVTSTVDSNNDGVYSASEVGHVNGNLSLGSTPFDWLALPYKTETATGKTTSTVSWTTRNPYAKDVLLDIVSAPASEMFVTKHGGRIGGYGPQSEVYNPVVYLKSPAANNLYRVTALLSRYSTEPAKTAEVIPVQGTGNALLVHSPLCDDFIYTGKGNSAFNSFSTDADTAFIRKTGPLTEFSLFSGSSLKDGNVNLGTVSKNVDYFSLKPEGNILKLKIKGQNSADIRLCTETPASVLRDGMVYSDWVMENNNTILKISTDLNEHEFEISTENTIPTSTDEMGIFRPLTGNWYLDTTKTGVVSTTFHFGKYGDIPVIGDWNKDGTSDAGVFRPSNGNWYLDTTKTGVVNTTFHFGKNGDIPVTGDWNHDGSADAGVFRPSDGNWYLDTTKTGTVNTAFHFGKMGDIPLVGDWNNDGTADAAVFRPSTGYWYLDTTKTGIVYRAFRFGKSGDIPVVGDWNNDGTTDVAVFRPSTGYWYLDTTKTGAVSTAFKFGKSGDIPAVGDWNNDGTQDIAVFRPSTGYWYLDTTKTGVVYRAFRFGKSGDIPVVGDWK
jgi:hypothetical protein